jgi:hypothetical protein
MVIGRDIIPIHMINTYTQFPASGGGGGGSPAITLATTSTGGYNNAVKFAFLNATAVNYDYSGHIQDGTSYSFTLGTATSPTRTTQSFSIPASVIASAYSTAGQSQVYIIVGGYIRHNGSSISSPEWTLDSSAIISQSMSNSSSIVVGNQFTGNELAQDALLFAVGGGSTDYGIYKSSGSGSGAHMLVLLFGSGRGAILPASGDTFTIRMGATATVDGSSVSCTHDITVNIS